MTKRELTRRLTKLAGQMARCDGMPPMHFEHWKDLPPSLSQKAWGEIYAHSRNAEIQCKDWGYMLAQIVKQVREEGVDP